MPLTQPATRNAKTILPGLTVDDLARSITFYEALGFGVAQKWPR
jgi:catechol 2,3-dioxygenase-like lactoylglutathione lyase family enzyme